MTRVVALLLALVSLGAFPVNQGLVTDAASVFTVEEEAALEAKLRAFAQARSVELAVVTVPSLEGMSIEEYATKLFAHYGIGKAATDNGVLLLVAPNDGTSGKVRIEVGYGLEPLLPDGKTGEILRTVVVPGWRSSHRADGIIAGADAIMAVLTAAPAERATGLADDQTPAAGGSWWPLLVFVGLTLVCGIVGLVFFVARTRRRHFEELEADIRRAQRVEDTAREHLRQLRQDRRYYPSAPQPRRPTRAPHVPRPVPVYAPDPTPAYPEPTRRHESSASESSSSSSSSFDFGGGSSGGGGSSSDL